MMPLTLFMMQQIALSFCNNLIAKRMADQIHFISNIGGSPHHAHYQGEVFAFFFFQKSINFGKILSHWNLILHHGRLVVSSHTLCARIAQLLSFINGSKGDEKIPCL